ncbi:MAG TPA: ATP-dependent helicase [Gemmatimonadaceae bacterium]|nr:ATP-dependent helicase [Gemmatimonadaceae bacterium]
MPSLALPDFTAELNAEQRAAATFGDGPLLIIAGAGTGKTRTLVYRVAHLLARGARPDRILLLTFTRRAAQEMLARAERLVGGASARVHGGTFHATAHRLLRLYGPSAGVAKDFTILDQGDAEDLMGIARASLGFGQKKSRFPKKETLHQIYSRHVNTEIAVDDILSDELPQFADEREAIIRIFADYTHRKAERNLVDYDDLLLFWAGMLAHDELGTRIAGLYDHVLVDEYQDTNLLQARILQGMCRTHHNITVVGDDAQSIYSFRGATIRNILDFPKQFSGATVVTLEENYRSTQPILDVTNALISRASERYTKNLRTRRTGGERPWLVAARDEHEQTSYVVDRVLELHEEGIALRDMAVLFRAGYMSAELEIELTNRKIPFEKWGGLKFLEAAHVKDVLAFLRLLENPRDEVSWTRVLLLLPGIGEASARSAMEALTRSGWDPDALAQWTPPARARDAHRRLVKLLDDLRHVAPDETRAVGAEIALLRRLYDDIVRDSYDHPEPRLADLDQLEIIAGKFPSRGAFLSELALEPPSATQDLSAGSDTEDDALILSTAHSAKGREWDAVFVIWAVDGWFPSSRALRSDEETEEERRLMYVALTRARDHLFAVYPLNVYGSRYGAEYSIDQLSRFIDPGVRERMTRVAAYPAQEVAAGGTERAAGDAMQRLVDLRALLRGRFGG